MRRRQFNNRIYNTYDTRHCIYVVSQIAYGELIYLHLTLVI